jgi:glycosyltransferase involved in cell wall biosynthesis
MEDGGPSIDPDGSVPLMPQISVVMGVHNGASHLAPTLDSIIAQKDADFELIVVDDGSMDATPTLLNQYARADRRVRVLRQDHAGLTRALIRGCDSANGALIARHDAGDVSKPMRLATQKRLFDNREVALVSCWTQYTGPEGEPMYVHKGNGRAHEPMQMLSPAGEALDGPGSHGSVMFRADAYRRAGGYRAEFYFGQDWDLWYRIATFGKFQMVPEALYILRVTAGSISSQNREEQQTLAALSREAAVRRAGGGDDSEILERAARVRPVSRSASRQRTAAGLYFIGECLRRNGDRRARKYLRNAVAADPLLLRAWIKLLIS